MRRVLILSSALSLALGALAACDLDDDDDLPAVVTPPEVGLRTLASGFTAPLALATPGDGSGRLFVVDQPGLVHALDASGRRGGSPWLDLRDRLVTLDPAYDERGLLGLAFHPDFPADPRIFVTYSAPLRPGAPAGWDHTQVLAELTVGADGRPVPASHRELLAVDWPTARNNGGAVLFGPDGRLYVSLGDGGDAEGGDRAQDLTSLHGSILRLDVDGTRAPYGIPADNPLVAAPTGGAGRGEIYGYGFRNPHRLSFDRATGELFVADAGQDLVEEVSIVSPGGHHGWDVREGTLCHDPGAPLEPLLTCARTDAFGEPLVPPIVTYVHPVVDADLSEQARGLVAGQPRIGLAAIGGYVYRGARLEGRQGQYVFADWSHDPAQPRGTLLAAVRLGDDGWDLGRLDLAGSVDSRIDQFVRGLGEDDAGELYLLTSERPGPSGTTGKLLAVVPGPLGDGGFIPPGPTGGTLTPFLTPY